MFINALACAIDAAHPKQVDSLSRQLWQAHAAGHIGDDDAQSLAERLHARRGESGAAQGALFRLGSSQTPAKGQNAPRAFLRAPEQRSPDRQASIRRRRKHAATGPLPPAIAAGFTTGETAVLRVIADEWLAHGASDRSLKELAARAGVCRSIAKRAVRLAELDGLITVQRRPRSGRKHLTNIIRVIRAEWIDWLNKGRRKTYATNACNRAKPDFRGVLNHPPRSKVCLAREGQGGRRLRETVENGGPRRNQIRAAPV
jgi:DNA-binding MarR family transcriptional regulator